MNRGYVCLADGAVVGRQLLSGEVMELVLLVHPREGHARGASGEEQAGELYERLGGALGELGAAPADVVTQRLYLADIAGDADTVLARSKDFYGSGAGPATSLIGERPLDPPGACTLLACAVVGADRSSAEVVVEPWAGLTPPAGGRVVRVGHRRHFFLHNLTARGGSFREQAEGVFARAAEALSGVGLNFHNVLRTWIYLRDIERDYDQLNEVRSQFFGQQAVKLLPASTGIEGFPHPPEARVMLELYALKNPGGVAVRPLRTATMNEAPEYGSAFTRGLLVSEAERVTALVSGTASVDERGATAHVGDPRAQMHRAWENFSGLLADGGVEAGDILWAVTYLKEPGILPALQEELLSRRLPPFPHQVVQGRLCRPEFLGEIEALARSVR